MRSHSHSNHSAVSAIMGVTKIIGMEVQFFKGSNRGIANIRGLSQKVVDFLYNKKIIRPIAIKFSL